jgi:hypothetical protein
MTPQEWAPLAAAFAGHLLWPLAVTLIALVLGPKLLALLGEKGAVDIRGFGFQLLIRAREQQELGNNPAAAPVLPTPAAVPMPAPGPLVPGALAPARPALQAIVLDVHTQLEQFEPNAREGVLVTALASARLLGQHEFNYNRIFGSQIAGLKVLDETGPKTVQQAREFFAPYAAQWPQIYNTYPFERWLSFMITSGLVARNGDVLSATIYGHDFLVYLREARLTEVKPG